MTRASYVSDHNSSRTMTPSNSAGDRNTASSNNTNRYSNLQGSWLPGHPEPVTAAPSSTRVFQPPDQYLSRPKDDRMVDQLFFELMQKRGWQNLPEQAKRQMLAYPASKKWTLVHQDRLTELQGEQKRKQNARSTYLDQQSALMGRAEEEGSPEWYVKKVMDDSITSKQLASLSVSLRTQPIRYVIFPTLLYFLRNSWID
jgi:cytokinesis protein